MNKKNKEYHYHKIFRLGQYAIPIFYGILIILVWLLFLIPLSQKMNGLKVLYAHLYWSPIPTLFVILGPPLFISFLFFVSGVLLWYLYWRISGISILIEDEAIIYKYRRGEKKIYFNDILYLEFFSISYFGGWFKIFSKEDTLKITVALENVGDFLQELKSALNNRGLSDCYNKAKFFRFLKTAVATDQSWERFYSIFWKLVLITIIAGTISFGFSTLFLFGTKGTKYWTTISMLWPTIIYFLTEIIFARRIAKESIEESFSSPPRNIAYEKKIYFKVILIGLLVYFIILIMAFLFSTQV